MNYDENILKIAALNLLNASMYMARPGTSQLRLLDIYADKTTTTKEKCISLLQAMLDILKEDF